MLSQPSQHLCPRFSPLPREVSPREDVGPALKSPGRAMGKETHTAFVGLSVGDMTRDLPGPRGLGGLRSGSDPALGGNCLPLATQSSRFPLSDGVMLAGGKTRREAGARLQPCAGVSSLTSSVLRQLQMSLLSPDISSALAEPCWPAATTGALSGFINCAV